MNEFELVIVMVIIAIFVVAIPVIILGLVMNTDIRKCNECKVELPMNKKTCINCGATNE